MKIRSKIRNYGSGRKMVEIPKSVRDNFEEGEEVIVEKVKI